MAGVNRVFPPLEELVSVRPDINIHSPLRKILEDGERFAKSADTNLDFRRPDLALQEYIKASIVAVEIVPRHKDYPSVQSDRGELHRLYQGLTKRIRAQHEKFGEVKDLIKENNARNGVKSTSDRLLAENLPRSSNGVANGHARASSKEYPLPNGSSPNSVQNNGQKIAPSTPPKKKPPIQPKPNGLHGKAIEPTGANTPTDLAARFARLRTPEANGAVQDPRIRTQPISIPGEPEPTSISPVSISSQSSNYTTSRPSGPREMPSVPTTAPRPKLIPLDVPAMPRAPDPIYNSPARNEDTTTTANLPSSAPRTSSYLGSGRKNSAPPISMVRPTPGPVEDTHDYFTPAHSVNGFSGPHTGPRKARPEVNIPNSTTIKAEQLYEYLKLGSHTLRVLLVDLRSREHFDNGHIMSQTIICVEPITLRHGLSGEELEDTLVIAPDSEQALYNKRHEFDLVVFYDQSSSSLGSSSASGDISGGTLQQFAIAVYEYGYEKRLKRPPMLLIGGLDAWVDLLGPNSLQLSSAGTKATANGLKTGQKVARPLGRVAMSRTPRTAPPVPRRLESRPLTKDEETTWSEAVNGDKAMVSSPISENHASDEVYYARTTDDFMRRYPEVSTIQESMMSVSAAASTQDSFNADFVSTIPRPPARPPPALPRQRSSGISDRGLVAHTPAHNAELQTSPPKVTPGFTGLSNPKNFCYMNATLQALSATGFFRNFLIGTQFPEHSRVPKRASEVNKPPQLMCRNLQNLYFYLWCGEYSWLTPRTLHVCIPP
jgi:ubiquitin carboxyl-terminal hydrolase 8